MVGAGSNLRPFTANDVSDGVVDARTAFVAGATAWLAGLGAAGLRDLHTFARCPTPRVTYEVERRALLPASGVKCRATSWTGLVSGVIATWGVSRLAQCLDGCF